MNQDPPPIPDQPESFSSEEETTTENPQSESTGRTSGVDFDGFAKSVQDALETGKKDAKKLFDDNLPKVKEEVSKGAHDVAYAFAFATAFTGALIREVAPDSLVDGLRDGASAGQRAAEEAVRKRHEEKTPGPEASDNDVGSVPV
ncbi:MAG: hypothetical protein P1U68_11850 [Verrucomicrobiales bacterium]|nr:hypothetical protein [Verrucomicrobiales bacterium]